jgi:hypothetical protein
VLVVVGEAQKKYFIVDFDFEGLFPNAVRGFLGGFSLCEFDFAIFYVRLNLGSYRKYW